MYVSHSQPLDDLEKVARSNVQLMNQLIRQGKSESLLKRVNDAYGLCSALYSGYFHGDGKPFVGHCVAVASIVAMLNQPDDLIVAAVVHNIYGNGDFGDGLKHTITPERQARVQAMIGEKSDGLLQRFQQLRIKHSLDSYLNTQNSIDPLDQQLLIMDLADHLEKYLDGALAYYGDCQWIMEFDGPNMQKMMQLARKLSHPELGLALQEAHSQQLEWMKRVPDSLRNRQGQKYLVLRVPGSCVQKPGLEAYGLDGR